MPLKTRRFHHQYHPPRRIREGLAHAAKLHRELRRVNRAPRMRPYVIRSWQERDRFGRTRFDAADLRRQPTSVFRFTINPGCPMMVVRVASTETRKSATRARRVCRYGPCPTFPRPVRQVSIRDLASCIHGVTTSFATTQRPRPSRNEFRLSTAPPPPVTLVPRSNYRQFSGPRVSSPIYALRLALPQASSGEAQPSSSPVELVFHVLTLSQRLCAPAVTWVLHNRDYRRIFLRRRR